MLSEHPARNPPKKTADLPTNKPPVVQRKEVQEELKTSPMESRLTNKIHHYPGRNRKKARINRRGGHPKYPPGW